MARQTYHSGPNVTADQVAQVFYQGGFRGDALINIVAIVMREAGLRNSGTPLASTGAHGTDAPREALSGDLGLAQLNWDTFGNKLIQAGIIRQRADLLDAATNARAAYWVYQQGGFAPWGSGGSGYTAGGNPLAGTNVGAASAAVQRAASAGLLGKDYNQSSTTAATTSTSTSTTGPTKLPADTRLVQNDAGLFALFQIGPGVWIHYSLPRDGSVVISKPIEKLTNAQYKAKYGASVSGSSGSWTEGLEELTSVSTGFGTYQNYINQIFDQVFTKNDPRRKDPEILRLMAERAGRPDMEDAEFENRIKSTRYYQTRTEGQLRWNDLSEAERQTERNDMGAKMAQAWLQYAGEKISIDDPRIAQKLEDVASGKMGFGQWTEQFLKPRAEQNGESPWSRQLREERESQRERPISIENTVNQLRGTLERWGLTWDERTLATYARQLIEKTVSDDDINKVIRQQAKNLYPWKDEATETIVAAAPWLEAYNRTMERQGTLRTTEVAQALYSGEDPWTFTQRLRGSAAWRQTKNGRDEMYASTAQLGRELGFENG